MSKKSCDTCKDGNWDVFCPNSDLRGGICYAWQHKPKVNPEPKQEKESYEEKRKELGMKYLCTCDVAGKLQAHIKEGYIPEFEALALSEGETKGYKLGLEKALEYVTWTIRHARIKVDTWDRERSLDFIKQQLEKAIEEKR